MKSVPKQDNEIENDFYEIGQFFTTSVQLKVLKC